MHAGKPKNKKQNSAPYISYYKLSKVIGKMLDSQNLTQLNLIKI
jgi:hypothetical protein